MNGIADPVSLSARAPALPPAPAQRLPVTSWYWLYMAIGLVVATLLVGGTFFYQSEQASARRKIHDNLDIVSSLKVAQIVQWRRELLGNAEDLASQPHLVAAVERWLRHSNSDDLATITTSLRILKGRANLNDAMIVDTDGLLRLNLAGHFNILDGTDYQTLFTAMREHRPSLTGLHPHIEDATPHVDVIAPLIAASGKAIGAVILESDAASVLFPMLASWPTASTSSETLLVHRSSDAAAVEILNPTRHYPGAELDIRISLDRTEVPAVQAVLGHEGIFEGVDYRGERVVSALRPIPGSDWFLVTKIDVAEAYADWQAHSRLLLLLMATLTLSSLGGLIWLRRRAHDYRDLSRAEAALRDHKSHLEETVQQRTRELNERNARLAVEIVERKTAEQALRESQADLNRAQTVGKIGSWRLDVVRNQLTWSPENHRIFGVPENTAMTYETFLGIVHPDDRAYVDQAWRQALGGTGYDIEHRLLVGGQVKWVSEKAELEFDADGTLLGGFGTTQDITEQRLAASRLQEANERLGGLAAEQAADLRQLAGELTRAEQQERDRLYELLHDDVQPLLVAVRLGLSGITENTDNATCVKVAAAANEQISQALTTTRTLSRELSPPLIRERGLGPALESLCRLMESYYNLAVDFACDPDAEPADVATRLLCFNAVRELLLNVVKHAHTGTAELNLQLHEPGGLYISVIDRGQGFEASPGLAGTSAGVGSGLSSIERRLSMIGGRLAIRSRPNEGTIAEIWAPLS
ncbi:MAG: PAS domain-containing protein [Rhodocyclales bacterium]|nr:PAS domain-containing protein [Rhodocyclales bacterium]